MELDHRALLQLVKDPVRLLGPLAGGDTAGNNFNPRYSEDGLLPCIIDIASGEQGSDVQGENGFMNVAFGHTKGRMCDRVGPLCSLHPDYGKQACTEV